MNTISSRPSTEDARGKAQTAEALMSANPYLVRLETTLATLVHVLTESDLLSVPVEMKPTGFWRRDASRCGPRGAPSREAASSRMARKAACCGREGDVCGGLIC